MKIIDLLNKIANGEIETFYKFKYRNKIVTIEFLIDNYLLLEILNDEIEFIEDDIEQKKLPEKLDYCEENTFMIKCKENSYLTREEIRLLDSNFKELGNKINDIIDYLKSKGE